MTAMGASDAQDPEASHSRTPAATCRPSAAATSDVSAPCRTLPTAKTPDELVRSAGSTRGPFVPGSISRPASLASSWSGIQSPVKTTVSQAMTRVEPVARSLTSTPSTPPRPRILVSLWPVRIGTRRRVVVTRASGG